EGLTVTYMPRPLGGGNADTLQQRARFFGYKRAYFGYCRVFLDPGVMNAFQLYVESEEHVRKLLAEHQDQGLTLRKWRRMFKLDNQLRPTRRNILPIEPRRYNFAGRWCVDLARPYGDSLSNNLSLVEKVRTSFEFSTWQSQSRSDDPHQFTKTKMSK